MTEPFIGSIQYFAFDYAPDGYLKCNGQTLPTAQNQALFSLINTVFGGNTTNFALPDYRGRAIVGFGQSTGTSTYQVGQKGGVEKVAIPASALPAHTHTMDPLQICAASTVGNSSVPKANFPANVATAQQNYVSVPGTGTMTTVTTVQSVGGAPMPVMTPYIALTCCIAVKGIYPPRP